MNEFDQKAATWDDDPAKIERAKTIAIRLKGQLKKQKFANAMEYGSGTGLLGFEMLDIVDNLSLMDESIEMTKIAQSKIETYHFSNVNAVQVDLMKDPLPIEKFDFIFTMLTFHHILDTDKILEKLYNIATDNCILAIIDLEKEDGSFHTGDFHGHLGFEKEKLEKHLSKKGFKPFEYSVIYSIKKENGRVYPLFLSLSKKG